MRVVEFKDGTMMTSIFWHHCKMLQAGCVITLDDKIIEDCIEWMVGDHGYVVIVLRDKDGRFLCDYNDSRTLATMVKYGKVAILQKTDESEECDNTPN